MNPKIKEAAEWAAAEFERRTRIIAADPNAKTYSIYWVSPDARVSWHEICSHFDMQVAGMLDRVDFHPAFIKAMRKRGLLPVLRGKMKSDEWVAKHGGA